MADGIFEAVKVAIQKELEEVRNRQREQDEHVTGVKTAMEQLVGLLETRAQEAQQLREATERNKSAVEALEMKAKQDLDALAASWKDRFDRIESDEAGVGGLEQIWRKLGGVTEGLNYVKAHVEEHGKVVGSTKSRTDAFGDTLKELSKRSEEVLTALQANDERLSEVESLSLAVRERQQVVEDSVAKKYSTLWEDVLVAIEDVKNTQAQVVKDDLERRSQEVKHSGRGHIKYVTQLISTVHDERKKLALAKDLMNVWREQTWTTARRKTGLHWLSRTLHSMAAQRQRRAYTRWVRSTSLNVAVEDLASRLRSEYENLASRLQSEYKAQIPDVLQVLDGTGLRSRCDKLDDHVAELRHEKCSNAQVAELVAGTASLLESKLEDRMGLVHSIKSELREQHEALHVSVSNAHEKHDVLGQHVKQAHDALGERVEQLSQERVEHLSQLTSCGERLDDHERRLAMKLDEHERHLGCIRDSVSGCATSQEVQNVLQDLLLMWNSIKQLDIAKADRKDVDASAAEASAREKQASKALQDVHAQVTGLVQEEVGRVDVKVGQVSERVGHVESTAEAKWTDLDARAEDGTKQFQRWQEMWEKLAGCVEDLVARMAEIQQNATTGKLPSAAARPPSRPSSAPRSGRAELPKQRGAPGPSDRTLPESASADMLFIAPADRSERAGPHAADVEAPGSAEVAHWASSARGLVDAALDQTLGPGSGRSRPGRPKSASARRSLDRSLG